MLQALQFLSVLCATLFAGMALYISIVKHPARIELDTRAAAAQWVPSYRRVTRMPASLAVLSFLGGTAAWLMGAGQSAQARWAWSLRGSSRCLPAPSIAG